MFARWRVAVEMLQCVRLPFTAGGAPIPDHLDATEGVCADHRQVHGQRLCTWTAHLENLDEGRKGHGKGISVQRMSVVARMVGDGRRGIVEKRCC